MPRFRKKPVEIEARQMPANMHGTGGLHELAAWCGGEVIDSFVEGVGIAIQTLEGTMIARPGEWILRGVKGEFYPCKPDIFEATYEGAETASVDNIVIMVDGERHETAARDGKPGCQFCNGGICLTPAACFVGGER